MIHYSAPKTFAALLLGASSLALAVPACAQAIVFADNPQLAAAALRGERVSQSSGVTQLRLASGATLSFVEGAEFQLLPDGSVDLFKGNVTVTGAAKGDTRINLAGQSVGRISGSGSSGSFSVGTDRNGKPVATGRVLTGTASVANSREDKRFVAGQAWEVANGRPRLAMTAPVAPAPRQTRSAAAAPPPAVAPSEPRVASIRQGGPAAAAQNGVPVVLGQALAAAGASGDIVSAGQRVQAAVTNPSLETFPSGDLAALVAHASRLESLYGGRPFDQAQADVIRAYLGYLANGGSQAQFLTVYAGLMVQFLDLVRSGAAPSSFSGTSLADINAFVSYRSRTSGFAALTGEKKVLVEAYAAFLLGGGNADQFVRRYTSLTSAYFAFLRGGGDPLAFQGASQETLTAYITFLSNSGLLVRLADSDRALLQVYLAGGGTAFIEQYRTALTAYYAYLASGKLPGSYTALEPAVLRQYLETLQATGLFEQALGAQAEFYAAYLAQLKSGGSIDTWDGLPANVFAAYAQALNAYHAYLASGGLPSGYSALTQAQIRSYLAALQSSDANGAFLGDLASFYSAYFTFLAQGGNPDLYTGLPTPNYRAYADVVSAYLAYLQAGGVPSAYSGADLALLQRYIKALIDSGKLGTLLAGQAEFLTAYYAYLSGGGSSDGYSGLPVYASYVTALEAYYAYLAAGGAPSGYTLLTQEQILAYLKALTDAGVLAALFDGTTLTFIQSYYVYLAGGGNPDQFSGLPVPETSSGRVAYVVNAETTQLASPVQADVTADGKITRLRYSQPGRTLDFNYAANAANLVREFGHFGEDVAWTRYQTDTANNAVNFNNHLLVGTPSATIPASGKVDYILVGGTPPTDYNAAEGTVGTFTGSLAVSFGSEPAVGLSMDVTAGSRKWHVQTPGGSANPSNQGLLIDSNRQFSGFSSILQTTSLAGPACISLCESSVYGGLFGADAAYVGFGYTINDRSVPNPNLINGVAVFGRTGTALGYLGNAPSTGGGGNGGGAILTSYTGGFDGTNPLIHFVTTLKISNGTQFPGSESGFSAAAYTIASNGGLASYTRAGAITRTPGTMTTSDIAGDADVLIGRWNNGTNTGANVFTLNANQGFHYMMSRAVPTGFAVPRSGTVQYDLLAATRPTWVDGSGAPGTLTASLAINFGTTIPRIAMEGRVAMPTGGVEGGAYAFDFATTGGLADISRSQSDLLVYPGGQIGFVIQGQDGLSGCASIDCTVGFTGAFAGSADKFGVTYSVVNGPDSAKWIIGAAAFHANGNSGVTPPPATSATLTAANTYTFADGGTDGYVAPEVDVATDGAISRIKVNTSIAQFYQAPAVLQEHGRFGDAVAWSRWDGSSTNANLNPNTHILTGTSAVQLPASGKVNYELTGSTAPTDYQAPDGQSGTVSGSLAVQFGSQVQVGFNLEVQTGTHGWNIGTNGGAADPSNGGMVVERDMRFASGPLGIARLPSSSNSCQTSCSASAFGSLYGTGASHVGVGYQINDISGSDSSTVNGVVVFGQVRP